MSSGELFPRTMSDEIVIIIINEKINVAFSRRTARTRNSHKKTKAARLWQQMASFLLQAITAAFTP